jgi:hypothetical protein
MRQQRSRSAATNAVTGGLMLALLALIARCGSVPRATEVTGATGGTMMSVPMSTDSRSPTPDYTITPVLTPPTEFVITPGPGTPTPFIFSNAQEVLSYAEHLFAPPLAPMKYYIRRSNSRDITLMQAGPGARLLTPDPTEYPDMPSGTPGPGEPQWIIGLVADRDVTEMELSRVMQLGGAPGPGEGDYRGRELYVILDDVGNVFEANTLDGLADSHSGGSGLVHRAIWHLADIDKLVDMPREGSSKK